MSHTTPSQPIAPQNTPLEQTAYVVLFTVSFCHFLNDLMQATLPALYPIFKVTFDLNYAQIGLITLVIQLTSSILQPLVGLYADKHHHAWQLPVGMLFTLFGVLLLAWSATFGMVLIAVGLMGCGSSVFHPQASQIALLASGGRKGLAQSIFQVGGNAGFAIGPLLAAMIILPYGLQSFQWLSLFAVICALLLVAIGKWHMKELKIVRQRTRLHWTTAKTYSKGHIYFFVFVLFLLMFSKNFYAASMTNFFTFFLIDKFGVSVQSSQLCLFAFLAAEVVGTLVGGALGDRFGRRYIIWFSILGATPFTLILPFVNSFYWVVVLSVVIGLIMASAFSAILVYATDLLPQNAGVVAGLFYGLSFGLGGIGSGFFGWLADATNVRFVFEVSAFLPLLGIVAIWLPKMQKR